MPKIDLERPLDWNGRIVSPGWDPENPMEQQYAQIMMNMVQAVFEKTDPDKKPPGMYCMRVYHPDDYPDGDFMPCYAIDMSERYYNFTNKDILSMQENYHLEIKRLSSEQAVLFTPNPGEWELAETWEEPMMQEIMERMTGPVVDDKEVEPTDEPVEQADEQDEPKADPDDRAKLVSLLEKAYGIIDCFQEMLVRDVMPQTNTIYMTDDFEGLESARGMVGTALDMLDVKCDREKLLITSERTRHVLEDACRACQLVAQNTREDSDMADALAYLQNCYYVLLNATYQKDDAVKGKIEACMEVCDHGLEAIDTISAVPESECETVYLNPSGQTIHPRLDMLRHAFDVMRPKFDPDKNAGT